jgi:hypothetical protein
MEIGRQKQPLLTGGKRKKKEQGKSLWRGEGLTYFKRAKEMERGVCG